MTTMMMVTMGPDFCHAALGGNISFLFFVFLCKRSSGWFADMTCMVGWIPWDGVWVVHVGHGEMSTQDST